jgi:hypothetical protein
MSVALELVIDCVTRVRRVAYALDYSAPQFFHNMGRNYTNQLHFVKH